MLKYHFTRDRLFFVWGGHQSQKMVECRVSCLCPMMPCCKRCVFCCATSSSLVFFGTSDTTTSVLVPSRPQRRVAWPTPDSRSICRAMHGSDTLCVGAAKCSLPGDTPGRCSSYCSFPLRERRSRSDFRTGTKHGHRALGCCCAICIFGTSCICGACRPRRLRLRRLVVSKHQEAFYRAHLYTWDTPCILLYSFIA
jgi:hypothetical protein